jgi:hypothetical protein
MALDPDQIEKLRLTLTTSGWKDVMEPVIAKRAHDAIKSLVLRPSERSGEYKEMEDSEIRARIKEAEWNLAVWRNEINIHDANRTMEELQRREDPTDPAGPGRD